ncbi:hypothetical protein B0A48_08999 [Cryoendolithus antarcticus]|uniref:CCZ1/INTU/HSP4 first Longin domain-containing protein n=1 Tax=Cryoendolithus antarcticus TaxID=1507870 RepID=A0A1V8T245_9PEZI|nr:hypothetical protein B0A48_08999 [Cryoendolithus antarcticus]
MTSPPPQPRVTPARLSFLAIYNPTLGPTDETFADQLVFWYSRAAAESRTAHKKREDAGTIRGKGGAARGKGKAVRGKDNVGEKGGADGGKTRRDGELQEEENERLRQIGLAQGMVHFARTFSNGEPVDSVETEKSRIVLKELEEGWWVLASIDLTRLPSTSDTSILSTAKSGAGDDKKPQVEYSAREVSPPLLLIQQLVQAHHIFSLHHGFSLDELFVRTSRDRFCSALGRYWNRFARSWDVLLHGNPAVDALGGLKLASGGELGFGVGEEEWGSGERDVLEDVVHRTEGLVDMVVARYGEPAPSAKKQASTYERTESLPWLGSGDAPTASDGVFFSGVGAVDRPSLRNIAFWMQHVYTQGEYAYGVHDNPSRERRKTRRRPVNTSEGDTTPTKQNVTVTPGQDIHVASAKKQNKALDGSSLSSSDNPPQVHDRVASHDHATGKVRAPSAGHPSIPPPIVSAAEQALQKATAASSRKASVPEVQESDDSGTTMGIPDQYMKYMTFGLSSLAKSYNTKRPELRRNSTGSSTTLKAVNSGHTLRSSAKDDLSIDGDDEPVMSRVEPIPDGDALKARLAYQIRQESKGCFLIGYTGDLDVEHDVDEEELTDGSAYDDSGGSRTVLRTVHVKLATESAPPAPDPQPSTPEPERGRKGMPNRQFSSQSSSPQHSKRLRVLVYVHRPFVYTFLFEQRADSLSYTAFYKSLHRNLQPIHKPLLTSTNPRKVAQRIENSHTEAAETASTTSTRTLSKSLNETSPIYDLLYDPLRLTVHTSIPDISAPGTSAAEGLGPSSRTSAAPWTRLDALNVHSQILSSLASTTGKKGELERTSKTSRGWWIVWLRLPPSTPGDTSITTAGPPAQSEQMQRTASRRPSNTDTSRTPTHTPAPVVIQDTHRIAFLVRRANDASSSAKASTGSRVASGMWSSLALRGPATEESTGGAGAGWGPAALAGGIGVDARKYVEGLLSLNR